MRFLSQIKNKQNIKIRSEINGKNLKKIKK